VTQLVVMMFVRFPLSLRNVKDLLFERRIDIWHETVRFWWARFEALFAADILSQPYAPFISAKTALMCTARAVSLRQR
jgi:transposase-like protein